MPARDADRDPVRRAEAPLPVASARRAADGAAARRGVEVVALDVVALDVVDLEVVALDVVDLEVVALDVVALEVVFFAAAFRFF